jgi:iron complex transport system substrate-binding protein
MLVCARPSDPSVFRTVALVFGLVAAAPVWADAPGRVVSMNLCTDQLALLIAAPGQLVSVSYLSQRPEMSSLAERAAALPANHGRAEELFLMRPDIVLADVWSSPATVSMLQRLGIQVVQFTPGASMDEIRDNILRMGAVLGQEERATEVAAAFEARLATLTDPAAHRPRAALFGPNSYTAGVNSLSGQIVRAAGYDDVSGELGLDWGGTLPLELLVMAAPDLVIASRPERGKSRAEEVLLHPALAGFHTGEVVTDQDWACATPFVLDAVERLVAARRKAELGQ